MDFKVDVKTLKKMAHNIFPFGIIGILIGFGVGLLFVSFIDVVVVVLAFVTVYYCIRIYGKVIGKSIVRKDHTVSVKPPWEQRKPCPECGSLTTHKKDCSNRKVKP